MDKAQRGFFIIKMKLLCSVFVIEDCKVKIELKATYFLPNTEITVGILGRLKKLKANTLFRLIIFNWFDENGIIALIK